MRVNPAVLVLLIGGCFLLGAACGGVGAGVIVGMSWADKANASRQEAERARHNAEQARIQAELARRKAEARLREVIDRQIDEAQRLAREEDKALRARAEEHWRQIQEGLKGLNDDPELREQMRKLREQLQQKLDKKVP